MAMLSWSSPSPCSAPILFEDVTSSAGIRFVHEHGGSGRKFMVETMGSGACFLDYDQDGDPDLYLVQGAPLPGFAGPAGLRNALYRNEGVDADGTVRFLEVTADSGAGDAGWGMGCAAADVNGDGTLDLLVTNFGPDVLLRNNGDGTFSDITAAAGVGDPRWSTSASFADVDGDGHLDLYVARYVDFSVSNHRRCGPPVAEMRSYCHPGVYNPVPDSFYRNRGDGTFVEEPLNRDATAPGHGLGVVWTDVNGDGRQDLYVANDGSPNFLFLNRDGSLHEAGLLAGVAVNEDGEPEAGMGVEASDLDGDGRVDLFVTHLEMETNTLYRNLGDGQFVDWSLPSGIATASLRRVGFGTAAIDYDLDGDLDLLIANGHILDDAEFFFQNVTYAQPMQLLENDGSGRFRDVGRAHGQIFSKPIVGRGLATADVDGDGRLDAVVTSSQGPARLLRARGATGSWIELDLRQPGHNPFAIGARLTIVAGDLRQVREVRSASSYLSQNALTVHAGLGAVEEVSVIVQWPAGGTEMFQALTGGGRRILRQGAGRTLPSRNGDAGLR